MSSSPHPTPDDLRAGWQLAFHLDNAPLAVIVWDRELRVIRWNRYAEETFGWTAAEVLGRQPGPDWDILPPGEWEAVVAGVVEQVKAGGVRAVVQTNRNLTKTGEPRWVEWRHSVQADAAGRLESVLSLAIDVTDRKRAEADREVLNQQLLDASKWESLGVLAGGVAHDFNNILTIILGNAGLARKLTPSPGPVRGHLEQIEQACLRAADLCRQMLAYSGRGPAAAGTTDLNQLIRNTAGLLSVPASRLTQVSYDLAEDLPAVRADAVQIRQVLVNLVMNAAEAVGDAPAEIVVRTRAADVPAGPPAGGYHLTPAPGRYARLTVADTGPGIPPEVKARMFDPFFTTKFAGRGLGLSAVLGILRAHAGAIRVDSEPGAGTTVEVLWPVAAEAVPSPALVASTAPPRHSAGKAMVVDDEMFVREVTASALEELGYEPLLAGDGLAAVELFRQYRDAVRVAVIDIVMPGMTGDRVLEALRALEPGLPGVLVSGFTDRPMLAADPRTEFLQKPFRPEELLAAVRRVLAAVG
jgi:PAS domain S-box-containing protein